MAKKNTLSDTEKVTQFIRQLDKNMAAVTERIRQIILSTDKEIGEQIKWNAPCFYYTGTMKPFDPKEYKRDIVVMNLHKGRILLVFPTGAGIRDGAGILEGDYKDGRRMVRFKDMDDVNARAGKLQYVLRQWLELVEK